MVKIYGLPSNKRFKKEGFDTTIVKNAIGHASGRFKNSIGTRQNSINNVITEKLTKWMGSQFVNLWKTFNTACQPGWLSNVISSLITRISSQSFPEITLPACRRASSRGKNPCPITLIGIMPIHATMRQIISKRTKRESASCEPGIVFLSNPIILDETMMLKMNCFMQVAGR